MQSIIIDEQFKFLLPALDEETYRLLEENILEHGCIHPLILWQGILIDGYNRYKICTEHNIPFSTIEMEFESREEVVIWIIETQIGRRNLTDMQLSYFRGVHYNNDKKIHGDISRTALNNAFRQSDGMQTEPTARRLGDHYKVSSRTIERNAKLAETLTAIGEFSPNAKMKILTEEVPVNRTKLQALSGAPLDEIKELARQIENGEYDRYELREKARAEADRIAEAMLPELRQLNTIIRDFAGSFDSMLKKMETDDATELKPVVRSFINQLEELYGNL